MTFHRPLRTAAWVLLLLPTLLLAPPGLADDEPLAFLDAAATLACDGIGDGTWNGCRGTGCSVCAEKLTGYDCYFDNHPECILNSNCQGWFFDCDAACPAPTEADRCASGCDGIGDGTWNGCRGTGCSVCAEKLVGYDCYFENHPECILNSNCQGSFFDCDSACPPPTAADRCTSPSIDDDGDAIGDGFEQTMITRFAPRFRLYPTDPHRPSSAEWYLARTHMRFHHSGCSDDQILNKGQVTTSNITQQTHRNKGGWPWCSHNGSLEYSDLRTEPSRFFLQIPNDSQEGQTRLGAPSTVDWACYAHVRRPPGGLGGYDVQYWIFFPYNGDTSAGAGAHEGDWEHVTAWVSSDGETLLSIYYSAHNDEGAWYAPSQIEYSAGRPVAYTAWHTHASYPWAGVWERGILGDDFTASGGPVLDCSGRTFNLGERNAVLNGKNWLLYSGRWGEIGTFFSGPHSPVVQDYWDGD